MAKQIRSMKLRLLEGREHISGTTANINRRIEHENKMNIGEKIFKPSADVLKSKVALKQFKRITKIYMDFEFVTDVDNDTINSYCLLCADLDDIYKKKDEIENNSDLDSIAKLTMYDKLKITTTILRLLDLKLKYEDKLFLNPAARLRRLPKKEAPKPENYLDKMGLNNI